MGKVGARWGQGAVSGEGNCHKMRTREYVYAREREGKGERARARGRVNKASTQLHLLERWKKRLEFCATSFIVLVTNVSTLEVACESLD